MSAIAKQAITMAGIAVLACSVHAAEKLLISKTFEIDKEANGHILSCTQGGTCTDDVRGVLPPDLTSPLNISEGQFAIRIKLLKKPSSKGMWAQFCAFQDYSSIENCYTIGEFANTGDEIKKLSSKPSSWKSKGQIDWSEPLGHFRIFIKDLVTNKLLFVKYCGAACYTGNDIDNHMPITLDLTLVGVAEGSSFSGWDNYPYNSATSTQPAVSSDRHSAQAGTGTSLFVREVSSRHAASLRSAGAVEAYDLRGAYIGRVQLDADGGTLAAAMSHVQSSGVCILKVVR